MRGSSSSHPDSLTIKRQQNPLCIMCGGFFIFQGEPKTIAIEPNSKGEKCKIFDPQGKVIATLHEAIKIKRAQFTAFKRRCLRIEIKTVTRMSSFYRIGTQTGSAQLEWDSPASKLYKVCLACKNR